MKTLGILGGMGPAATVDFYDKVVSHTQASNDQEHVPVLIYADPRIPNRSSNILRKGADPYPSLRKGVHKLRDIGADFIAIPCNTAYYWYDRLQEEIAPTPILHIVDAAISDLKSNGVDGGNVGVLSTEGTVKAKIYETKLAAHEYNAVYPDDEGQKRVNFGIAAAQAGDMKTASRLLSEEARNLLSKNCSKVIMGCTEIPVALKNDEVKENCIDATDALARSVVRYASALAASAEAGDVEEPGLTRKDQSGIALALSAP